MSSSADGGGQPSVPEDEPSWAVPPTQPLDECTSTALILRVDGEIDGGLAIWTGDARISGLYHVRNSQKLTRLASETALSRR